MSTRVKNAATIWFIFHDFPGSRPNSTTFQDLYAPCMIWTCMLELTVRNLLMVGDVKFDDWQPVSLLCFRLNFFLNSNFLHTSYFAQFYVCTTCKYTGHLAFHQQQCSIAHANFSNSLFQPGPLPPTDSGHSHCKVKIHKSKQFTKVQIWCA